MRVIETKNWRIEDTPFTRRAALKNIQAAVGPAMEFVSLAEKELLLGDLIRREQAAGKHSEVEKLQQQLASELRRLTEECESKKENVRRSGA